MQRVVSPLIVAVGLAAALSASASTIIDGGSIINQTWTPAGSPYVVQGDIVIPPGAFLTIDAGTTVQFPVGDTQETGLDASRVEVNVLGSLTASGTAGSPVTFQSLFSSNAPNGWFGIVVANTAVGASLTNVLFRNSSNGIRSSVPSDGIVSLSDVTFDANDYDLQMIAVGLPSFAGRISAGKVMGQLTIPSGVTLALNRNGGRVEAGNFSLAAGSSFEPTLTSLNLNNYERLQVLGTVTLAGSLALDVGGLSAALGNAFRILDNDGIDAVIGTFSGLDEGAQFDAGAYRFQITYTGGSGNDVVLTVVPQVTSVGDLPPDPSRSRAVRIGPNPAVQSARVFFRARPGSVADVRIFDTAGRPVRTLHGVVSGNGDAEVVWDGRTESGAMAASGVFHVQVLVDGQVIGSERAVLVR